MGPCSLISAAQNFHHTLQEEQEFVSSFIRRLERAFCVAYGADNLKLEMRHAFFRGQLQEGLKQELMRSPSVSELSTTRMYGCQKRGEATDRAEEASRIPSSQISNSYL